MVMKFNVQLLQPLLLCNTTTYDRRNKHQSNVPEDALAGLVYLDHLWGENELKVHFMNPKELRERRWRYGGYILNAPQILSWVKPWNDHAIFYPKISLRRASKQDAHIRVWFNSSELIFEVYKL